jgi:hypothetical protein
MGTVRARPCAVVVSGLPNVNDYIGRINSTRMMALNDDDGGSGDDEGDDDDDDDDDDDY